MSGNTEIVDGKTVTVDQAGGGVDVVRDAVQSIEEVTDLFIHPKDARRQRCRDCE